MHAIGEFMRQRPVDHALARQARLAFEGPRDDGQAEMRLAALPGMAMHRHMPRMTRRFVDDLETLRRQRGFEFAFNIGGDAHDGGPYLLRMTGSFGGGCKVICVHPPVENSTEQLPCPRAAPVKSLTASAAQPSPRKAIWLLLAVILVWGANWPIMKIGLDYIAPLTFAAVRLALGGAVLFLVLALRGELQWPSRQDLPVVCSVGLFQLAGFLIFVNLGLLHVEASRSAILSYTTMIWVTPAAILLLGERSTWLKISGVVSGLAGIAVMFNPAGFDWTRPRRDHRQSLALGRRLGLGHRHHSCAGPSLAEIRPRPGALADGGGFPPDRPLGRAVGGRSADPVVARAVGGAGL